MALTQLAPPYPIFTDKSGDPLDNGYLYFGEVNKNPETNPIQVYYDSAFTQPAAQPLRTSNGYVMRNGSPALIYADVNFSVTIRDKNNALVIYSPVGYGVDPAAAVTGAVTVQDQTGDGVTTLFGMGASPNTINATNVYIDGVYQEKDTYTISGSNITFSEAPPLNAGIEIVSQESPLIGGASASQISYNEGSVGAVNTTVKAKLQEFVSVKDFGAVGDGVTDDTGAIQAALNQSGFVFLPQGNYKITSQLVFGSNCTGLIGSGSYNSVISKQFNGNAMLCDSNGAILESFGIEGNGATYTGAGIVPRGYNVTIRNCRVNDTAGSCIYIPAAVGSNDLSATYLSVVDCFLLTSNPATVYAISSLGTDDSTRPTVRTFERISGGGSLVDFSGMNRAVLSNSFGTICEFDANCSKITLSNNRFSNNASSITVLGSDHIITGNTFGWATGYNLIIDSTVSGSQYDSSNINIVNGAIADIQDNITLGSVGTTNELFTELGSYTTTWKGSTTDGTFGNSTVNSNFQRNGRSCTFSFSFIRGSTATIPTGTWSITLPFKSRITATGSMLVKSSTGTWYTGSWRVYGGSNEAYIYLNTTGPMNDTTLSFGTNAQMDGTINFPISQT